MVGLSEGFAVTMKVLRATTGSGGRMGPADPAPVPTVDGVAGGGVVP